MITAERPRLMQMASPLKTTMRAIAAVVVSLAMLSVVPFDDASAQNDERPIHLDASVVASAEGVFNGQVTSTQSLMIGTMPHTVTGVAVDSTFAGGEARTVFLVTEGGTTPDGTDLLVSHTPHFEIGDEIQVAVRVSKRYVREAVAVATGASEDAVFMINFGEDGVAGLNGTTISTDFAGAHDYVLNGAKWSSFTPPATYYINPNGSGVHAAATIAAIQRAAQAWEDDSESNIDFRYGGTTTRVGESMTDGVNTVTFENRSHESYLAIAYWSRTAEGQYNFDIVYNTRYVMGDRSGTGQWFDIESTALHEFGHMLGLGHTSSKTEVMSSSIVSGTTKPLGSGDLAGVRELYPQPVGTFCNGRLVTVNLKTGEGSPTNGNDVILGTSGADKINALGGDDVICAGGGNDTVYGGAGNDTIFGQSGHDFITGGDGDDSITGHSGNDTLKGNDGADTIIGSAGNDTIDGGFGDDALFGRGDNDRITGGQGADQVWGEAGADHIDGGADDDYLNGGGQLDVITGGDGNDTINGEGDNDLLSGGNGDDEILGAAGKDTIRGQAGNDTLYGNGGHDKLYGEAGNDILIGASGNDYLYGADGDDMLYGRVGNDRLYGQNGADSLYGEGGNDLLSGDDGDDILSGGVGSDSCAGGAGSNITTSCP